MFRKPFGVQRERERERERESEELVGYVRERVKERADEYVVAVMLKASHHFVGEAIRILTLI